ncbi:acetoacetate--CoA ligase [Speluncibacter jeojiensis]|uniref:Acetoacetate--CoA ligase n=1 Tax=Speluncibacter jeojiensis TaxID=2710754 RepID=A0A9X4RFL9_9ACTN|nr:acetoacetate--CoA ligase [Corynebacteriales bacterium D3-21]
MSEQLADGTAAGSEVAGTVLWEPTEAGMRAARITDYHRFAHERHGAPLGPYADLWRWSTEHLADFWRSLWEYFDVPSRTDPGEPLAEASMPGARWFPGARLNYVDQVFRNATAARPAVLDLAEDRDGRELSWAELRRQVAALAATLRDRGVGEGDRVVGYLPNIAESAVAFLATASLGAVWAACGQDYSAPAATDRLGQLAPKALITADGYRFAGREHDRRESVTELRASLGDSLELTVVVPRLATEPPAGTLGWAEATAGDHPLEPVSVPFDHPLWVVFSSGTTGLPKGIVHGHGGVVLEHLKQVALHTDLGPDDTFFWFTSPSWMMWNFLLGGLLCGSTIVCYDGSPAHPGPDGLWALAARHRVTVLGTSPGYLLACIKAGAHPGADHELSALRTVGVTGATLPASTAQWLCDELGPGVQIASVSGGTDVVTAFLGTVPTVPVWAGELSAPSLGVALDAFDDSGRPVRGKVGELVITAPMPSMPVAFWNDPDGHRYRDAYFDTFPGVWRHGDWITITGRGSVQMHGRSDSTLNRNGIRMGSADIYQAVESLPEILEALVIGAEQPDGGYWMPLFVVPAAGVTLDEELERRIAQAVREQASPRHVPDEVIVAPGIPHTRTGKKLEVPIKRILQGADPAQVLDLTAVDAPELIAWYADRRAVADEPA